MKLRIKNLMLDIIDICNLNCVHCYNRTKIDYPKMMTLEQVDKAADEAVSLGVEKIYLTGGEPLLHPDLLNILSHLATKYKDIEIGITTNGLLLTQEMMDAIYNCGNIVVQISIDGTSSETYEMIRGENTFSSFIKGFNVLRNSKALKKTARTCVSAINYKEVPSIYKMCIDANIEPSFLFVTEMGNAQQNWGNLNMSFAQKLSVIDKINVLNKSYNLNVGTPIPAYKCNFTQLLDREPDDYGEWGISVRTDGQTSCCQFLYDYPIGNIFTESIEEMFLGNVFCKFMDMARKRRMHYVSTSCNGCLLKNSCGYGCLGLSVQNGDATNFDGLCDERRMYALFKGCNYMN